MAGRPDESEEEDEEFEYVGNGRAPIPKRPRERPPIPERPDNDPGSADEDGGDEAPQIVVLKEGKHLTAREVENIKRKGAMLHSVPFGGESTRKRSLRFRTCLVERGLPPLPEHDEQAQDAQPEGSANSSKEKDAAGHKFKGQGLSFSSASSKTANTSKAKRKAVALLGDSEAQDEGPSQAKAPSKKKKKKQDKKLLSFGDDA